MSSVLGSADPTLEGARPARDAGAARPGERARSQAEPRARGRYFFGVLLDVVDCVLDGADLLGVLVRNVDLEGLLERENELDQTEGVRAEVLDERGLGLDVLLLDVELLLDDALDLARDVLGHFLCLVF